MSKNTIVIRYIVKLFLTRALPLQFDSLKDDDEEE